MADEQLRNRLIRAANDFPVRGWPADLHRRVIRRQRRIRATALSVGVAAAVAVAVAVPLVVSQTVGLDQPAPAATATTARPLAGTAWSLTAVTDGHTTEAIPATIGARLDLLSDGKIQINDGINSLSGRFTLQSGGFEVTGVTRTYEIYYGPDPAQLAAIRALYTLAFGNPDGRSPSAPVRNSVVRLDDSTLVVASGPLQLSFSFAGEARSKPTPAATTH
jgi:heat shock protein HslJ